jgi:putative oxidoreductase
MADQPHLHEATRTEAVGRSGIYPISGPSPTTAAPIRGQGALAHPEERESFLASRFDPQTVAQGIGRALFGGFFLFNGINHFRKRDMLVQYAASKGVNNPEIAVMGSGALLIAGGLSVLTGNQPKLGAAALAAFLIGVTPKMHAFWTAHDEQNRMHEFVNFTKNLALLGAAALTATIPEPWPASLHLGASRVTALVPLAS